MNFYKRKRRMPTVIIVSLIDIFAILLIFVIVTTTFKRSQPSVVIKLPESSTAAVSAQAEDPKLVVLSISPEGDIRVNNSAPISPGEELTDSLKKIVANGQSLALTADTNAPFGKVVSVMDSLKEAGLKKVSAFTVTKKERH